MKKINANTLLLSLQADVKEIILQAHKLQHMPQEMLEFSPATNKWSVAQILEHLNIYSNYYLPIIDEKLKEKQTVPNIYFTPGWLGNYFTSIMKPTANGSAVKKMQSPKSAVPSSQPNAITMLEEFIKHQHTLLRLLEDASAANLNRVRIPTSLNKMITLKLGDTFRFFIAHEQRHFVQIKNNLQSSTPIKPSTNLAMQEYSY